MKQNQCLLHNQSGSVLFYSLIVMSITVMLTLIVVALIRGEYNSTRLLKERIELRETIEAGWQDFKYRLIMNPFFRADDSDTYPFQEHKWVYGSSIVETIKKPGIFTQTIKIGGRTSNRKSYQEKHIKYYSPLLLTLIAGKSISIHSGVIINGSIYAKEKIEVSDGAEVHGNLYCEGEIIQDGIVTGTVEATPFPFIKF